MARRMLIVAAALALASIAGARQIDRSLPPIDAEGAGGFTIQRLPGRPGIDGRAWMLADVHAGKAERFRPEGADYELELSDPRNDGDVERWAVTLHRAGSAPVPIAGARKTAFVYVTPDARFIFMEPLVVVDVVAWERYDLGTSFGVEPYLTIRAVRPGGHELFVDRRSCVADCADRADDEYFDVVIP